jgi:hypothetical protein
MLSGRLGPDINNRKQRCKKQQCQGANERTPKRRACCPAYSRRVEQGLPKAQPATAAETPGNTMKSINRSAPLAWKISGPHTSAENAVPAAPNPSAAHVRGHRLKNVVTWCMALQTSNASGGDPGSFLTRALPQDADQHQHNKCGK